jgi:hypothetical protein
MSIHMMYNRVSIGNRITRPILGRILGFEGMPTYPTYSWNDCMVHIKPHDYWRGLVRSTPFYNGSIAEFDFVLQVPKNKILTNDVTFTWRLHFKGQGIEHKGVGQEPDKSGSGIIRLKQIRQCKGWFRMSNTGLIFRRNNSETAYNLRSGVSCGRLLGERGDYELTLHISNDDLSKDIEMVGTQFELRNIDDYHAQFVTSWQAAAFGAIAGLAVSVIWFIITGKA